MPASYLLKLTNGFRKATTSVGFTKGYNFVLWIIFAGALMGFTLSRSPFLNFDGIFCGPAESLPTNLRNSPGECYYYRQRPSKIGILIHLATILPASFLVCFQFVPIIRHKLILFHRINGYVILLLSTISIGGAWILTRHAFGGEPETQIVLALLGAMFLFSLGMAVYNIKRLQIAQHRAWMLRAWFYAGSIISLRLIMLAAAAIISGNSEFYTTKPCYVIDDIFSGVQEYTLAFYPECASWYNGTTPDKFVAVRANANSEDPVEIGAAYSIFFGASLWLALFIHAVGVEVYLNWTSAEDERLRKVSLQRRIEAGLASSEDSTETKVGKETKL